MTTEPESLIQGRRVTVLDGYFRSGDFECFCFDKWDGPDVYYEVFPDNGDLVGETDAIIRAQHENRVYPDQLLPEGARYGKWTITVEFEPLPVPPNDVVAE